MSNKVVVTGGAGFIGSHLVRFLAEEKGLEVHVVDDLSTGLESRVEKFPKGVSFHQVSIVHGDKLLEIFSGARAIFHQAAIPSVPRSVDDPVGTTLVNVQGTLEVLEAARKVGVKRVVFAASSSAYGDTEVLPKQEDMPMNPLSPYAVAKCAGETYMSIYARLHGMETVALRYFNIFGPGQDPKSDYAAVIPKFMTAALRNEPPTIFGTGKQSRDFTYIDNAVQANWLASQAGPEAWGKVMNIACGERITLLELWQSIRDLSGCDLEPEFAPKRRGDVDHSLADISRAAKLIGYRPEVTWQEGLKRAFLSYREAGAVSQG